MQVEFEFTKMHGIGNDYIYVNCLEKELPNPKEVAIKVSDRHFGIGADGLVLILPSTSADFRMRMFNADGSESEMCGNAVRCIAKYLYDQGICKQMNISLETLAGPQGLELILAEGEVSAVRVDMGEPILTPAQIPVKLAGDKVVEAPIEIEGRSLSMTCLSMGNPHAVFFVDKITDQHVLELGPKIERHALFPNRVNAEFVEVLSANEVNVRVWERGSGETLACGTGAAAVCVAGVLSERTSRKVTVHLRGGDLELEWAENNRVYKTGPATSVFEGRVCVEV